jgi:hypothetical protein
MISDEMRHWSASRAHSSCSRLIEFRAYEAFYGTGRATGSIKCIKSRVFTRGGGTCMRQTACLDGPCSPYSGSLWMCFGTHGLLSIGVCATRADCCEVVGRDDDLLDVN